MYFLTLYTFSSCPVAEARSVKYDKEMGCQLRMVPVIRTMAGGHMLARLQDSDTGPEKLVRWMLFFSIWRGCVYPGQSMITQRFLMWVFLINITIGNFIQSKLYCRQIIIWWCNWYFFTHYLTPERKVQRGWCLYGDVIQRGIKKRDSRVPQSLIHLSLILKSYQIFMRRTGRSFLYDVGMFNNTVI